jgi:signal transduction histidine kinase
MQNDLLALPMTLLIRNVDKSSLASQMRLLGLLDELAGTRENTWPITTANSDPLEKVYRGEFLEQLYYRLAILTLRLPPLRERQDEIVALAAWFARDYARKLNLSVPQFSEEAQRSLRNYLWFGNASELETVIARTLAYHRKPLVQAEDLIFDFGRDVTIPTSADLRAEEYVQPPGTAESVEPKFEIYRGAATPGGLRNGHPKTVDLNVVIHELAHEFKNPMVTIKTFAQLLAERYQDESFRCRFQEVVGADIERMDDLLEMMIEYADFAHPRFTPVSLAEKVRAVMAEMRGECERRQARIGWKGNGAAGDIRTDEAQLEYILRNILIVILSEARNGSEIEIDLSRKGTLSLSYSRESARMASISHYLDPHKQEANEAIFPLRILLAKNLLERNGGRFAIDASDAEKDTLTLEFATAEHPDEE